MKAGDSFQSVTKVEGKTFVDGVECDVLPFVPSLEEDLVVKHPEKIVIDDEGDYEEDPIPPSINAFVQMTDAGKEVVYNAHIYSLEALANFVKQRILNREDCHIQYEFWRNPDDGSSDTDVATLDLKFVDSDSPEAPVQFLKGLH